MDQQLRIDDDLVIQSSAISYLGNELPFARVTGLMYLSEVNSIRVGINSIPAFYRTTLEIAVDGKTLISRKVETRFTRRKSHVLLDQAWMRIANATSAHRLQKLVNELVVSGSVELPCEPPARLFKSGDIAQQDLRINLRLAAKENRIEFGSSKYLYSVHDPDIVRIRPENNSLFSRKIEFTLRMNRDVILPLIKRLMEREIS